jgi:hypothetical protein
MSGVFFEIALALSGALAGALVQLLRPKARLIVVLVLAWLLSSVIIMWVGYEIGLRP